MSSFSVSSCSGATEVVLSDELYRLARFGAELCGAQSCFIFLPGSESRRGHGSESLRAVGSSPQRATGSTAGGLGTSTGASAVGKTPAGMVARTIDAGRASEPRFASAAPNRRFDFLDLKGYWSSIQSIQSDARVPADGGLIGWIVRQRRPLHISPFENDSRVIGPYVEQVPVRSFLGLPILLAPGADDGTDGSATGALICDHPREMAFTRTHGMLLNELAHQIAVIVRLAGSPSGRSVDGNWRTFMEKSDHLVEALGFESIAVLRLRPNGFSELEQRIGLGRALDLDEQVYRLVTQALPPHFPATKLPNGEIVILLDAMMASFFEMKIQQLAEQVRMSDYRVSFSSTLTHSHDLLGGEKGIPQTHAQRIANIEALVAKSASGIGKPPSPPQSSGLRKAAQSW